MRSYKALLAGVSTAMAITGVALSADRVKLRTGQTIDGNFLSGDVKVVRVLLANGKVAEFPIDLVVELRFGGGIFRQQQPRPDQGVGGRFMTGPKEGRTLGY